MSGLDLNNATVKAVITKLYESIQNQNETGGGEAGGGDLNQSVDHFFLIVMGCIVFLMQCGFAFLEAGSVRSKNTVNILIKNMLDAFIAAISYWAIGWALAYGTERDDEGNRVKGNSFCGEIYFFSVGLDNSFYPGWFFQFVFAATAATIVSGSVAERCHFVGYFAYSSIITGWVYPVVTHWAWDGGWLSEMGYSDFAGSGVVHLLGAACALVGCAMIGPRRGRFTKDGKPIEMAGHSVPFAALGGFILLFGFLAFNGGSQLTISGADDSGTVALAMVNTVLGGASGGLTVLFSIKFLFGKKWSYLMTLNGALTGMVSMCAGCNVFQPWAALIVGALGGAAFIAVHELMLKLRLDDPLDAVAVHGGGGVIGVLMQPFFAYGNDDDNNPLGIFWGASGHHFGMHLLGVVAIFSWSAGWSVLIFGGLKWVGMLRIDRDTEFRGNDTVKHGEAAYPVDAWVELQYDAKKRSRGNSTSSAGSHPEGKGTGSHPMFSGTSGANQASHNNAMEMVPTAGSLFRSISKNFEGFDGQGGGGHVGPQPCVDPDNDKVPPHSKHGQVGPVKIGKMVE